MENSNPIYSKKKAAGKQWAGLIFLILGIVLLIRSFGGFIPDWITSWPMILILIGVFTGSRHNYRNPGSIILICLGVLFLIGRIIPGIDLHDFVFPCIIIGLGLYLILGKTKFNKHFVHRGRMRNDVVWDKRVDVPKEEPIVAGSAIAEEEPLKDSANSSFSSASSSSSSSSEQQYYAGAADGGPEDYLDTVSIFGGIKKNIVSKNFKGGDIVTIMGGAEINLTQADIHGTIIIDITQVFGGTKLILPPQWKVSSDLAALFGGIEDKRPIVQVIHLADDKVVILRGTSIFGGIDIRSY
ncbi:putative membrane protein [Arcticibacter pallidicorallinus]|uniref:Putative membrane protein n=2 Tax=Arcticibacter pallidicorallinus TaxID=1259464 RepID=A0A2T0U0J8_9SPHI|nr:putative membrane protein [Arcticibacter pallidicorallinus]